ncbi:MAG: hypothetical protein GY696_26220, partial [Gammaproteobacteria bacterium]|nr:hypothetical protein [Gammaproteobacteria bacterium]
MENYVYLKEKLSSDGERIFWRCERKGTCRARIHTDAESGRILKHIYDHGHAADCARVEVLRSIEHLKERAENTQESTGQVVTHATGGLSQAAKGKLPSQDLLKQAARRVRTVADRPPPNPDSLANLIIPPEYQSYEISRGVQDQFLFYDSHGGNDRILIFT